MVTLRKRGDWVRFQSGGSLVIGEVMYILENHASFIDEVVTDAGTVSDECILEARGPDASRVGGCPACEDREGKVTSKLERDLLFDEARKHAYRFAMRGVEEALGKEAVEKWRAWIMDQNAKIPNRPCSDCGYDNDG